MLGKLPVFLGLGENWTGESILFHRERDHSLPDSLRTEPEGLD